MKEMEDHGLAWDSYTYTALLMGTGDRQEVLTSTLSDTLFACLPSAIRYYVYIFLILIPYI